MSHPDWSQTSSDYAKHRQGFPPRFPVEPLVVPHRVFAIWGFRR
jgi:hypothetical protein